MRLLIGALGVAMLAGCVSPAMNDARSKSPTRVLASAKPTPLVAECIKFSWQNEGVFGVDASAYINSGKSGKSGELTVYTRDASSFADLVPQGTGTAVSYYAKQPDDSAAMRRMAMLATCL
ncbi:hypothetical protein [Pseudomonas paraversuta]|uniref:hypothetical protein n=1 Tax=Pseudomonas paraversuta TaxID=2750624 RepID=UPI001923CCBE|nr:hypothetical protein [Pseudomonas paraversuta]